MNPFINLEEDFLSMDSLLFLAGASGSKLVEYTATGNPATFNTNVSKPLRQLLIPFTPVQSGTGDPSPENVRSITGWTGINVTSNGTTIPITFPAEVGTVYGGSLDVVTGVLTVNRAVFVPTFTESGWTKTGASNWWRNSSSKKRGADTAICSHFTVTTYTSSDRIQLNNTGFEEISSLQEYQQEQMTAGTPITIVRILAEPLVYQLSDLSVPVTLIGDNVIWSDTNDENTVLYLKKG